jgi:hypothetical protein
MRIALTGGLLILGVAVSAALIAQNSSATPIAHLTLDSRPGDYFGGSHFDITYTPATSSVFSAQVIGPSLVGQVFLRTSRPFR